MIYHFVAEQTVSIKHPNHAIIKPVKKLNIDKPSKVDLKVEQCQFIH